MPHKFYNYSHNEVDNVKTINTDQTNSLEEKTPLLNNQENAEDNLTPIKTRMVYIGNSDLPSDDITLDAKAHLNSNGHRHSFSYFDNLMDKLVNQSTNKKHDSGIIKNEETNKSHDKILKNMNLDVSTSTNQCIKEDRKQFVNAPLPIIVLEPRPSLTTSLCENLEVDPDASLLRSASIDMRKKAHKNHLILRVKNANSNVKQPPQTINLASKSLRKLITPPNPNNSAVITPTNPLTAKQSSRFHHPPSLVGSITRLYPSSTTCHNPGSVTFIPPSPGSSVHFYIGTNPQGSLASVMTTNGPALLPPPYTSPYYFAPVLLKDKYPHYFKQQQQHQQQQLLLKSRRGGYAIPGFPPEDLTQSNMQDSASFLVSEAGGLVLCRICQTPGTDNTLIAPCKCAGSVQYVHKNCLTKWLEINPNKNRKSQVCELCHYTYHRKKKFKFRDWKWPHCSTRDKIFHTLFIFSMLVMIGCATAFVICFNQDKGIRKHEELELNQGEIVTLSCGVLFFLSFFLGMYAEIKAENPIYKICTQTLSLNQSWIIEDYFDPNDQANYMEYSSSSNSSNSSESSSSSICIGENDENCHVTTVVENQIEKERPHNLPSEAIKDEQVDTNKNENSLTDEPISINIMLESDGAPSNNLANNSSNLNSSPQTSSWINGLRNFFTSLPKRKSHIFSALFFAGNANVSNNQNGIIDSNNVCNARQHINLSTTNNNPDDTQHENNSMVAQQIRHSSTNIHEGRNFITRITDCCIQCFAHTFVCTNNNKTQKENCNKKQQKGDKKQRKQKQRRRHRRRNVRTVKSVYGSLLFVNYKNDENIEGTMIADGEIADKSPPTPLIQNRKSSIKGIINVENVHQRKRYLSESSVFDLMLAVENNNNNNIKTSNQPPHHLVGSATNMITIINSPQQVELDGINSNNTNNNVSNLKMIVNPNSGTSNALASSRIAILPTIKEVIGVPVPVPPHPVSNVESNPTTTQSKEIDNLNLSLNATTITKASNTDTVCNQNDNIKPNPETLISSINANPNLVENFGGNLNNVSDSTQIALTAPDPL